MKRLLAMTAMLAMVLGILALHGPAGQVSADTVAAPSISPASVTATMKVGTNLSVTKTVQTPSIPAHAHICFVADTTGSMGGAIGNVQSNILTTIVPAILADSPDAQFCAAQYKDTGDGAAVYNLDQVLTTNTADLNTAIGTWSASGGGDLPECQLNALSLLAANMAANTKPNATPFIVWFGDATGHDPCLGATTATTIAALQAAGIKVIAVDVFDLDADGQASAITAATSGVLLPAGGDVSAAIITGLTSAPIDVGMASDCAAPISTSFSANQIVPSGSLVTFKETIAVAANAKPGTYTCRDHATIDGSPMTTAAGDVIYETKTITVPNPEIIKRPDLANLWLCVACRIDAAHGIGQVDFNVYLDQPVTSNSPKGERQSVGSFSFEVRFDRKLVNVTVTAGDLLTRSDITCATISGQGFVQFRCNTKGKGGEAITGPGVLAVEHITPTADVYSMVIPSQENGIASQLINQECDLGDLQGHPIKTTLCSDGDVTLRYLEGDMNADCSVDVSDQQEMAFRWGSHTGQLLYNSRFDLEPAAPKLGDGDIDARDIQVIYGRHLSTCAAPHPAQLPVNPKATDGAAATGQ